MIELTAEVIRAKLSLLSQRLSQLVGACWLFLSKNSVQFFKEEEKLRILSSAHVVHLAQLHNQFMRIWVTATGLEHTVMWIWVMNPASYRLANIIITRFSRFCSALLFTTHAAHTLCINLLKTMPQATWKRRFGLDKNAVISYW